MFSGIVTDVGEVLAVAARGAGRRFRIGCSYDPESIAIGASIACAGPCLTVVARGREGKGGYFEADASAETLARTTLGAWARGTRVNLERPLRAGDEIGGHMVAGHVDAAALIVERRAVGEMARFAVEAPQELARFIAEKGSIALDGTSLTVNEVEGRRFGVMIVPHTLAVTTWGERRAGDLVNLEVDIVARYLARLISVG
jgi:riboflavin synthase